MSGGDFGDDSFDRNIQALKAVERRIQIQEEVLKEEVDKMLKTIEDLAAVLERLKRPPQKAHDIVRIENILNINFDSDAVFKISYAGEGIAEAAVEGPGSEGV